jgi:hypothetical protein
MGEQTILVCDVCGRPATETVTIRAGGRNLVKDLCSTHLAELTRGARAPRRGRRKGSASARTTATRSTGKRRGRPPKSASAKKRLSAKRSTGKRRGRPPKATGKRRGRPPKAQTSS